MRDDELLRRLGRHCIRPDLSVSSAAYMYNKVPDEPISVDLRRLTTPEESAARARRPGAGIGALLADAAFELGFTAEHSPTEDNYAHCDLLGQNTLEKCKRLAERTTVLIYPEGAGPRPL